MVILEEEDIQMILVVLLALIIPVTLSVWIFDIVFYSTYRSADGDWEPISPWRWLLTICIPLVIAHWGLKKRSLDKSGALAGILVGFVMSLSNVCFLGTLMAFFVSASKATHFRSHKKKKLEQEFKEGGQRNWVQVVCNGGIATEMAIFYLIDIGCKEVLINFKTDYNASWFAMAVLGAFGCAAGDTFASEFGTVVGSGQPRLITTFQKVPIGTNGGISLVGLMASILGGLLTGFGYYIPLCLAFGPENMKHAPSQWPVLIVGCLAGFFGSLIDSFLGATLQYSGYNESKQYVVDCSGPDVKHICGSPILDNHSVNLVSTIISSLLIPKMAYIIWWYIDTQGNNT